MSDLTDQFVRAIKYAVEQVKNLDQDNKKSKSEKLKDINKVLFKKKSDEVRDLNYLFRKYSEYTVFTYLDQQLKKLAKDRSEYACCKQKDKRSQLIYDWQNLFGYVGIVDTSLVELILEDKDFSDKYDPVT